MASLENMIKCIANDPEFSSWEHDYNKTFPAIIRGQYLSLLMMPGKAAECGFPSLPSLCDESTADGRNRLEISHLLMDAVANGKNSVTVGISADSIVRELRFHFTVVPVSKSLIGNNQYTISWYAT